MELVIQIDEPLDHLHPFITKSGEQTQVLAVGSDTSGSQGREDRGLLRLLKTPNVGKRMGEMESRTIYEAQLMQVAGPKVRWGQSNLRSNPAPSHEIYQTLGKSFDPSKL